MRIAGCWPGNPVISEFMASNSSSLVDGQNASSDWIELYNQGDIPVDLQGWHLTDDAQNLMKWTFPSVTLEARAFLIVFASGNGDIDEAANIHTNFKLSRDGEFLALVQPDGSSIATQFPTFPNQLTDISYGFQMNETGELLDQAPGYFDAPSPGLGNPRSFSIGPQISDVIHAPKIPTAAEPLLVTAKIRPILAPVHTVSLVYRVMHENELTTPMTDDGQGGDAVAGDNVFTGKISAGVAASGQMLRYYVSAHDQDRNVTRAPRIVDTTGNVQSPMYFGTVIQDAAMDSELPKFHWYTENIALHTQEPEAGHPCFTTASFMTTFSCGSVGPLPTSTLRNLYSTMLKRFE